MTTNKGVAALVKNGAICDSCYDFFDQPYGEPTTCALCDEEFMEEGLGEDAEENNGEHPYD